MLFVAIKFTSGDKCGIHIFAWKFDIFFSYHSGNCKIQNTHILADIGFDVSISKSFILLSDLFQFG